MKRQSAQRVLETSVKKSRKKTSAPSGGLVRANSGRLSAKRNRTNEALERLGVTAEEMLGVPRISHMLGEADKGLPEVLEALRASSDPDAQAFVQLYDRVAPGDRERLSWEHICVAAKIDTMQFLGVAVIALAKQGQTVGEIISATSHPKIIKKTVQMAMDPRGVKDREMLHLARGWLPTAKGATMVNRIQIANLSGSGEGREVEVTGDLPLMDDFINDVHDIRVKNLLGDGNVR